MMPKPKDVYEIQPTHHFLRLRQSFLNLTPMMEIERTRSNTRVMMETEGEPMELRRAKALAAT